jgi:hypothetical protein
MTELNSNNSFRDNVHVWIGTDHVLLYFMLKKKFLKLELDRKTRQKDSIVFCRLVVFHS